MRQRLGAVTSTWMGLAIALHVACLVAINLAGSQAAMALRQEGLALSPDGLAHGRVWTLLSHGLLYDLHSPLHVLFSLLVIFFLGPQSERLLGRWGYLRLLLGATVLGGLLQCAWSWWWAPSQVTVGPSAAIMALVAHLSWSRPGAQVMLLFAVQMQARYLVWLLLGLDLLMLLSGQHAALWADVGGLAAAWFWIVAGGSWRVAWLRLSRRWRKSKGPHLKVVEGGARRPVRREDWN